MADSVGLMGASLDIPDFTKGRELRVQCKLRTLERLPMLESMLRG